MFYRPPNASLTDFFASAEYILELLLNYKLKCYLMEDFNINKLNTDNNNVITYINLFHSYNVFETIVKPTRVTHKSATIIDHTLWTNDTQNYIRSGIFYTPTSDHFPVFSMFSTTVHTSTSHVNITKRIIDDYKISNFEELKNYEWERGIANVQENI